MKKFVKRLAVLLIVPVLLSCALFIIPADKAYNYTYTYLNCSGQGDWIHQRLYEDTTNIDIAFIGSSHTICGVNDSLLEANLTGQQQQPVYVANIGYCSFGRNLHYSFARQLLAQKQTRVIVVEITERENRDGHPEFGYFAGAGDVFTPVMFFNGDIFSDIYSALKVRFFRFREAITGLKKEYEMRPRHEGYMPAAELADKAVLAARMEQLRGNPNPPNGFSRWFYNKYPFSYLQCIAELAEENNCELMFLYLPGYGAIKTPEELAFYKEYGKVLIAPTSIYDDPANWKDVDHMNDNGAYALAGWVAKELAPYLSPPGDE